MEKANLYVEKYDRRSGELLLDFVLEDEFSCFLSQDRLNNVEGNVDFHHVGKCGRNGVPSAKSHSITTEKSVGENVYRHDRTSVLKEDKLAGYCALWTDARGNRLSFY